MACRRDASGRREEDAPWTCLRGRALSLVDAAERVLAVGDAPLGEAAIHDLRVLCKRLRAVWHLLTPALGRRTTRQPERALRAAARSLAGQREAHVAQRTLDRLARRHAHDDEERAALEALAALAAERWPEARAAPSLAAPLRETFAAQREALAALPRDPREADLEAGLLHSYVRARDEGHRAALLRDPAAWHRCRRWAKYELYQLELLAPAQPEGRRVERLGRLGDTLGRFNDLCTLRALAESDRARLLEAGAAIPVVRILAREERALRARMERRFVRLYARDEGERALRIRRLLARNRV